MSDLSGKMKTGQNAVASCRIITHNHVTRLLATEVKPVSVHRFKNVAVTHRSAFQLNALLFQVQLKTQRAHHCSNQGIVFEATCILHRNSENGHNFVAVHHVALLIHCQAAIGIAVMGNTHISTVFYHGSLELFGVSRAHAVVDIRAIWLGRQNNNLRPQRAKRVGRNTGCCTVSTVKNNSQTIKTTMLWHGGKQVSDVAILAVSERANSPYFAADWSTKIFLLE
ncbi:Uncharacterised protein [Mycobacteroides abscessus subsp. abscessus]|nr:Uncharacterised protein [Mycobacteroides abscessus subsp. abscessus]